MTKQQAEHQIKDAILSPDSFKPAYRLFEIYLGDSDDIQSALDKVLAIIKDARR